MYIERVPNRSSPPAVLLRESFREGNRVRKRTVANLSNWPTDRIEALRAVLKGGTVAGPLHEAFDIERTRPHGHVAAVLGTLHRIGLPHAIAAKRSPMRSLVEAMIASRVLHPSSKLATVRALRAETLQSTLGEALGASQTDEDALYEAMDWLLVRQERIEKALAGKHLTETSLVLYDVSSTYFEGRSCPLAQLGHSRDGKSDRPQIVFGLLCATAGCPIAVEVFEGNVADPKTLRSQIEKMRTRFGLARVVLVGDRGMITSARIAEDFKGAPGIDWITALRAPQIKALVNAEALQLSLFDEKELAEISSPDFPGERLVVCRNPFLADERTRKRGDLLAATERELEKIASATARAKRPLRGAKTIALKVGRIIDRYKMAKHFILDIGESHFRYRRDEEGIAREAALDGIYVLRTNVAQEALARDDVVRSYKQLANVERAFRSMKTVDLEIRPIHHRKADRVRAHVLICMLAYYVEWHMRQSLRPILFDDDNKAAAEAARSSPVARAEPSERAQRKAATKRTEHDEPVHSFQTLLADLATIAKNRVRARQPRDAAPFDVLTRPTPLQQRAFDLLGVPIAL
jgi:hypothetical protein